MIYVGQRFTSTMSASIVKEVTCGKCGDRYLYRMARQATGEGSSPYYLDNAGAQRRAEERAHKNLEAALLTGHENVPCPACNALQPEMVRGIRSGRWAWMNWVGGIVAFLALIGIVIYSGAAPRYEDTSAGILLGVLVALAGLGLVIYRYVANRNYDPNAEPNHGGWASACEPMRYVDFQAAVAAEERAQAEAAATGAARAPIPVEPILQDEPAYAGEAEPAGAWYYSRRGTQYGPVTGAALQALAADGQIDPADPVWTDGMPEWTPAGSINGLFGQAAAVGA